MVEILTHSAVFTPRTQSKAVAGMSNPEKGTPSDPIMVFAQPISTSESYRDYGVELSGAYAIQAELEYAALFVPDTEITLTPLSGLPSFSLVCTGKCMALDAGDDADHIEQLCYDPQFAQ